MMAPEGPHLIDSGPSLESTGLIHRLSKTPTAGPHPCVVMLHGRSGSEDAMWVFARALPTNWLVVSPRGIKPDPAGGFAWHPRQRDEWPPLAMFEEAVEAVAGFIGALPSAYGADPSKIYLMGFSQVWVLPMRIGRNIAGDLFVLFLVCHQGPQAHITTTRM